MPFTRAQATALLNKSEMQLFDDSRANALRGFDRAALAGRVERARASRDRARDLLKRQRLAARKRGEGRDEGIAGRTARKEALLVEILQRFTEARRNAPVQPVARKATKTAAVKKAAVGKSATAKKAAEKKKAAVTKPAARKSAARKSAAKSAARKSAAEAMGEAATRPATRPDTRPRKRVSRARALDNTRRLLEEQQQRARAALPWHALDPVVDHASQAGYQSEEASGKALRLHQGESRMASIHGSSSTRNRRNQGKRDHRGDTE